MHDAYPLSETPPLPLEKAGAPLLAQNLWDFDATGRRRPERDRQAAWRRGAIFAGAALTAAYLTRELYYVLKPGGLADLEIALLALFVLNISWLSIAFVTALAGFAVIALGLKPSILRLPETPAGRPLKHKTAVLILTYNEPPERIFGTALATGKSLAAEGCAANFDIFVLSDTTDPDIWVQEEAAFQAVREHAGDGPRIYYRRRTNNAAKKAGNVADWCHRWGQSYEYMIILDADSLMTGELLVKLEAAMEAHADAGLIQTIPASIGRRTLFARLQQFSGRVYGPVIAAGLAFWHRGAGNFWGHNAIIRVRAFTGSAGLPQLTGKPPFGGHILSHDFVEAALLCRAGWRVYMAPELTGSYEESPPTLIDYAVRDRRWCQGNLQHSRVVFAKGLHWLSRVHLGMGILAYLSALFWLLFLGLALVVTLKAHYTLPLYFGKEHALFPTWPMQDSQRAMGLLFWTLAILLLPKLLGYALVLFNKRERQACGGAVALTAGVAAETLLSSLFAHIMMVLQSSAILEILRGRDSGWNPQRRDDGSLPAAMIVRYHLPHMILGLCLAALTYTTSLVLFLWLLPASLGLTLSGPLSAMTARRSWGERARRAGLFLIPEENPPPLIALQAKEYSALLAPAAARREAITQLAGNPRLRRLHTELIRFQPLTRESRISANLAIGRAKLEVSGSLSELLTLLKPGEKAALLADPESLARLEALIAPEPPPSEKQAA